MDLIIDADGGPGSAEEQGAREAGGRRAGASSAASRSSALSAGTRTELRLLELGAREDQTPNLSSSPLPARQLMLSRRIRGGWSGAPGPPVPRPAPGRHHALQGRAELLG